MSDQMTTMFAQAYSKKKPTLLAQKEVMAQKNIKKVIKDFITYIQTPTKKGINLQIITKNKNYFFRCVE